MASEKGQQKQASTGKQEIKMKKSAKAEALKKAPDELIARAIHDTLVKQHEERRL